MEAHHVPVLHLEFVLELLRRDDKIAAVALSTGAGATPRLDGIIGRQGAQPELVRDPLRLNFHDGGGR